MCCPFQLMLDFFARVFCMQKTLMDKKERVERRNSIAYGTNNDPSAVAVDQASNGRGGNNVNLNKNNKDKRHHVDFKYDRVGVFELQPDDNWRPMNYSMGSDTDLSDRIVPLPSHLSQLEAEVREIKIQLKRLEEKGAAKAHKEYLAREWKLVALVLDRLFFFVYLVAIVVSALALFETTMFQTGSVDENDT